MSKKIYNLGKVKGRTPEFRLTEKILEIKYDDETIWSALVDFSAIASSFDLRLNEETYFLEAQREVDGEWEEMVDLSALKLAHEHSNKDVLDKITSGVFTNISDAVSKKHTHENIDTLNQVTDEHIQNINQIPAIQEEMSEFAPPQLTEGIFYSDETKKGLSANKNAIPTADYAWIEGEASKYHSFDELMSSATLDVVTSTSGKSTNTTVTIKIVCNDSDSASFVKNTLSGGCYHIGVVFEDTPDKTFYIKISSATISDTTVSVEFTFIDGQETFPITGNITRAIQSLYTYPKNGVGSHIEGLETIAAGDYSHVQGKYNEIDTEGKYAHIVGNGTGENSRFNAHTLDWVGNAWFAGSVEADSVNVNSIEAYNVLVPDSEFLTKTQLVSDVITIPYNKRWNLQLENGWYTVKINETETTFEYKGETNISLKVGNYTFQYYVFPEEYWPPMDEISISGDRSSDKIAFVLWGLDTPNIPKIDLVSYINRGIKPKCVVADTISVGAWEGASRETMLSDTISTSLNWYPLFPLEVGSWYMVTIDGVESKVKCSNPNGLSALVGDFSFNIWRAWFDENTELYVFDHQYDGIEKSVTIEKMNLPKVDLMTYIDSLTTRIKALESQLTGATATADEILETIGGEG